MTPQLNEVLNAVVKELDRLNNQREPFVPYFHQEGELRVVVSHPPKENET